MEPEEIITYKLRYLVIPDFIYEDNSLSLAEIKIYGFIHSYKGAHGFYFSNEQIANLFSISTRTVTRAIESLSLKEYIKTDYKIKAGGGEIRFIFDLKGDNNNVQQGSTSMSSLDRRENPSRIDVKVQPYYIKDNKIKDNKIKDISDPPNKDKLDSFTEFIETFNLLFGTSYKLTTGRREKFKQRLKQFTLEEIIIATKNLSSSQFHTGKNDRGWKADPDFLLRSDEQIDKWLNENKPPPRKVRLADLIP